jgi:hypothetical protein
VAATGAAGAIRPRTTPLIGRQLAELEDSNPVTLSDGFGYSVGISGTTAIVGAPYGANSTGRAYVFTKTAAGWKQTAELTGSDSVVQGFFGYSVGISGTTAIVGAWNQANGAGRAYVFTKTPTGWKQTAELKCSGTPAEGTQAVAISGSTAAVGASGFRLAYLFEA